MPAELISASSRRPRACGGGPSSSSAFCLSCDSSESAPIDRECIRLAGCRGDVGSKVCDIVVVAVVKLPALPFLLVCENNVCGGLVPVLGSGLVADETGWDWAGDVDVLDTEVEMLEGSSSKSVASLLSREARGVPAVIVVSTD